MDWQLQSQLKQTLLVANSSSVNSDGENVYGASTSFLGRAIDKVVHVRNSLGETVMSSKQIICGSSVDVRINSLLYLPGETTSANSGWSVSALALRIGEAGSSDHWKIWLGGVGGDGGVG